MPSLTQPARSGTQRPTAVILVLLALLPWLPLSQRNLMTLTVALVYATAAVGLDLFAGYGGQLSICHFGFVSISAYASTWLATSHGWSVWATIPVAMGVSTLVSLVLAAAIGRLRDLGVALVTFFFSFVVVALLNGQFLVSVTNGVNGLLVTPLELGSADLTQGRGLYYITLLTLVVASLVALRYVNCRAGRVLRLVKRSDVVAMSLGVQPFRVRTYAFCSSALIASLAGITLAQVLGVLSPEAFTPLESVMLFAMVIVGGQGSIAGPILGAILFTVLNDAARFGGGYREIVFALFLLLFLIAFRRGLFGMIERVPPIPALARLTSARPKRPGTRPDHRSVDTISLGPSVGVTGSSNLYLHDVGVEFGGLAAVQGVTFTVPEGRVCGLMGPNGAGKTTLINCISGLQPHSGTINLGGANASRLTPQELRRSGLCRTFQHPSLVPDLSIAENVELGTYGLLPSSVVRDILPLPSTRHRDRAATDLAHAALDLIGFPAARRSMLASDLSLAEQKVVDIARALAGSPKLLLLDEPTAGLEFSEMETIAEVIQKIRRPDLAVLVIAHHVDFLRRIADDLVVMDFGKVVAGGEVREVIARQDVSDLYLGVVHE